MLSDGRLSHFSFFSEVNYIDESSFPYQGDDHVCCGQQNSYNFSHLDGIVSTLCRVVMYNCGSEAG
jgi:hypothetical protein